MRDYDLALLQHLGHLELYAVEVKQRSHNTVVTVEGKHEGRRCKAVLFLEERPEYCNVTYEEFELERSNDKIGRHTARFSHNSDVATAIDYFNVVTTKWNTDISKFKEEYAGNDVPARQYLQPTRKAGE